MDWDVFISHAWEDKEAFARPLAEALETAGLRVWYDEFTLRVGDKLLRSIDHGLANSRYGVVILSPHFFAKEWPQRELAGLAAREAPGEKVILPVWHNITAEQIKKYSPTLADRVAVLSDRGLEHVMEELLRVMKPIEFEPVQPFEPEMVLIPAGEFLMGMREEDVRALKKKYGGDQKWWNTQTPQHKVYLPDYGIGKYPVTNFEYRAFVQDTGHQPPGHWEGDQYPEELGDHPVVNVSWRDAVAYCEWLSQKTGKPYRLPSEAEWEKAARGADGRLFPWGDEWDTSKCNTREGGPGTTTPVGQYSPDGDSPFGVADMAGNVWEWCADWFQAYEGNRFPDEDYGEMYKVLRGGSWGYSQRRARGTYRVGGNPHGRSVGRGFRVSRGSSFG